MHAQARECVSTRIWWVVGGLNSGLNFSIKCSEPHPLGKIHNPGPRVPQTSYVGTGPLRWLVGWLEYRFVHVTCCNSGLCMHDFGARASAPWKIFCCLLKFLLKKCYKCRVGSKKSESRGVGWLVGWRQIRKRRSGPNVSCMTFAVLLCS